MCCMRCEYKAAIVSRMSWVFGTFLSQINRIVGSLFCRFCSFLLISFFFLIYLNGYFSPFGRIGLFILTNGYHIRNSIQLNEHSTELASGRLVFRSGLSLLPAKKAREKNHKK